MTLVLVALLLVNAPFALAAVAPHVSQTNDTDACALCHRSHTAGAGITAALPLGGRANALGVGFSALSVGDTELCYSCHGIGALGSQTDVQAAVLSGPGHALAPSSSVYGPSPKQCSDCHDTHGSSKVVSSTPYPALLRSVSTTNFSTKYNTGDAFCGACHLDRVGEQWDGVGVWRGTAHSRLITGPASGTKIACDACHAPHGSPLSPSIVTVLATPSAPATVAVAANDRSLCFGCHSTTRGSYASSSTYQAGGHGQSLATATIGWEWATRDLTASARFRRIGECQVCHNPMGTADASGVLIPRMARARQEALCHTCHGVGSAIASDVASSRFVPTSTAGVLEVVSSFGATPGADQYARLQVYTRESTATTTLVGPREYLKGRVGDIAAGDVDGDGYNELVVARRGAASATVLGYSPLSGLEPHPGLVGLLAQAEYLTVADVLADVGNVPELITGAGNTVRVYRWNGTGFTPLTSVAVTGTVSGLGAGQAVGSSLNEIVVTTTGALDQITLMSGTTGTFSISWTRAPNRNGSAPRGPSIGDLTGDGLGEIVVANSGLANNIIAAYSTTGTFLAEGGASGVGLAAQNTAVGDVLWSVTPTNTSGAEIAVSLANATADARLDVYPLVAQAAPGAVGFGVVQSKSFELHSNPTEVAIGDTDGDGRNEVAVAKAGYILDNVPPSTEIVHPNSAGSGLDGSDLLWAAGTESADSGPGPAWIVLADLGPVGPSRHAVEYAGAHLSTETPTFSRHVECEDCHNVHEATRTVASAPLAYGSVRGAWGVSVLNAPAGAITYTERRGVVSEYELCLKCHSGWLPSAVTTDIASLIDTRNPSVHAVEAVQVNSQARAGSFVTSVVAWSNSSILYCRTCHKNSVTTQTVGPHTSRIAPILGKAYYGTTPTVQANLCYECHRYDVYYNDTADGNALTGSNFYGLDFNPAANRTLHHRHGQTRGIGCDACHVSHGSRTQPHLLRSDLGYAHNPVGFNPGGSCTNACHGGLTRSYRYQ